MPAIQLRRLHVLKSSGGTVPLTDSNLVQSSLHFENQQYRSRCIFCLDTINKTRRGFNNYALFHGIFKEYHHKSYYLSDVAKNLSYRYLRLNLFFFF